MGKPQGLGLTWSGAGAPVSLPCQVCLESNHNALGCKSIHQRKVLGSIKAVTLGTAALGSLEHQRPSARRGGQAADGSGAVQPAKQSAPALPAAGATGQPAIPAMPPGVAGVSPAIIQPAGLCGVHAKSRKCPAAPS